MTYKECEQKIIEIPRFNAKNSGDNTRKLLKRMNCLNENRKIIHVAGTNGKGSVCAYLRSILMEAGFTCGTFISPHLVTMRERISIDLTMISEEEFVNAYEAVASATMQIRKEYQNFYQPSFFEYLFAMSMYCFRERKVEYIILETGLGGRLDATNVIQNPQVCVITSISYDHTQYLGGTISQIATEKGGIIKPKIPVVFTDKNEEACKVLLQIAEENKSRAFVVRKRDIYDERFAKKSIDFSFHSRYYDYISLSLSTMAVYQTENAALAVQAIEVLGEKITEKQIREGLQKALWPARMEEIEPSIYVDGAHNEDGMAAFLASVRRDECRGKRFLLFGVVSDKKYSEMIKEIADSKLFTQVMVTTIDTERSVSLNELKQLCEQYEQLQCSYYENAIEAFTYLKKIQEKIDNIYIAGSLYLAGQIKAYEQEV